MPRYNLLLLLVFPLLLLLMVMSLLQRQSAVQASTSAIQSQPDQRLSAHAFQPNPNELLVFEVNRAVTTADRGFPRDDPPQPAANGSAANCLPKTAASCGFLRVLHMDS